MVFVSLECRTSCGKCGQPVMVNGPLPEVLCHSCQSVVKIGQPTWRSLLGHVINAARGLADGEDNRMRLISGMEFSVNLRRTAPACAVCSAALPPPGAGGDPFSCPACGATVPAANPPEWLKRMVPEILLLVGAREEVPEGVSGPGTGQPVIFACPACGGNLSIDGTDRMVTCSFCRSSLYLPDDLWLRLHPVPTVQPWYLVLDDSGWAAEKRSEWNKELLEAALSSDANSGAEALEQGADPECRDEAGRSALYLAAAVDCRPLLRQLLERKAALECPDNEGTTPLIIAAYNGKLAVVQDLLEAGAAINARNKVGVTALYGAARNGHMKVVQLLLEHGADPAIPNEDGVTPADKAAANGHAAIASLLRDLPAQGS